MSLAVALSQLQQQAGQLPASGAFPVAFDPVKVDGTHYIDGGVVENLGVEGVVQYLKPARGEAALMLVSDLSAIPKPAVSFHKPSLLEAANHATDVTYQALHSRIYYLYSDGKSAVGPEGKNVRPPATYVVKATSIWPWVQSSSSVKVIVLQPTSAYERHRYIPADVERVEQVAHLPTLEELDRSAINDCVYVA